MSKATFLSRLGNQLKNLGVEDFDTFVQYYDEMIEDYQEDGYTEEEAVSFIDSIETISKGIIAERSTYHLPTTGKKSWNYALLILGAPLWGAILLAFILFVLSAYILLWCGPLVVGSFSLAGLIISVACFIGAPFNSALFYVVTQVGIGLIALGLGLLLLLLTVQLAGQITGITQGFRKKLLILFKRNVVQS